MLASQLIPPEQIKSIAVIGTGSVGASWASLFLAHGIEVLAHDPAPGAQDKMRAFVQGAWPALVELNIARSTTPPLERIRFFDTAAQAAAQADAVQENVYELIEVKSKILKEISEATGPNTPILTSTGGIPPTQLQAFCRHPERLVVVHPFNPTHLMPLIEVVGGKQTSEPIIEWAIALARYLGKQPIRINAETVGHMTNRLQFALMREAVACLLDGTASAQDIDNAVRYGLGPRWALMGGFMTLHLAGGPGGTRGILSHAAGAVEQWWTSKPQPKLTPDVIDKLASAGEAVSKDLPVADWVKWRDAQLVEVLKLQHSAARQEPGAQQN
jgi:carnitine 3-dehydrogenase